MTISNSKLRTELGKVRGLGTAHHGVAHWWMQRVTALALVPMSGWFLYALVTTMLSPTPAAVGEWFSSPFNTVIMVLMLAAAFMHAKLGVQVVVEDYVKGPFAKYALLLLNNFICISFAAVAILAVLKLHFADFAAAAV